MLSLIRKSLDGDCPVKTSVISVDELKKKVREDKGVGSVRNRGKLPNTAKMEEPEKKFVLLVPRHSHYVQQKKQYNQTMKPQGELYYLVLLFLL